MDFSKEILYPVIILTGIAIFFSILIAIFSKRFAIKKDLQVETVLGLLAGANCGACGYAGCEAFAKALVKGEAKLSMCNATNKECKKKIGALLGTDASDEETVVVCAC
ncbi:MAG: (Fe-S)-binding protein, partial [Clostridia bacterium]